MIWAFILCWWIYVWFGECVQSSVRFQLCLGFHFMLSSLRFFFPTCIHVCFPVNQGCLESLSSHSVAVSFWGSSCQISDLFHSWLHLGSQSQISRAVCFPSSSLAESNTCLKLIFLNFLVFWINYFYWQCYWPGLSTTPPNQVHILW